MRPDVVWQPISAGDGAKGYRWYDWALIALAGSDRDHDSHGGHHALLVRGSRTGELAFYRTWTSHSVPLSELVQVAGRRGASDEAVQAGKGLTGLDAHQVRRWTSWRRWTVLAMLAHAFLAGTAAAQLDHRDSEPTGPSRSAATFSPLTHAEIQHLLTAVIPTPARATEHFMRWSRYRRTSNTRARTSHYARQATALT